MLSIQIQAGGSAQNLPLRSRLVLGAANGLPEGALELEPRGDVAVALCRASAQIGAVQLPAGARRLLRAGESILIGAAAISLVASADDAPQTKLLAQAMLRGVQAPPRPGVPSLLWLNGPDLGKRVVLTEEATFIGRGEGCVARVNDTQASRMHAKLVRTAEGFSAVDLMSANGVLIDGERLQGTRPLRGGEVLQIGSTQIGFERPTPATPRPPRAEPGARPVVRAVADSAEPAKSAAARADASKFARLELALIGVAAAAVLVGGAVIAWAVC